MRKNLLLLGLGISLTLSGALMAVGMPTRSLPAAPGGAPQQPTTGVVYGKAAYVTAQPGLAGYLYLGISKALAAPAAGAADKRIYTLSRGLGGDDGAVLQAMLQTPFKLNGADQTDLSIKCAGKVVNNLTLMRNQYPVMTVTGDPATDPIDQIWVFDTSSSPLNILTNDTENINDASGTDEINKPIQALASAMTPAGAPTAFYVFAAVSAKDKEFKTDTSGTGDGVNRGIAVTKLGVNKLEVLSCDDFSSAVGKAAKLSLLPADQVVAFGDTALPNVITTAELASNDVAMHYDNAHLQRLYIGLSGVKRDDPTKEGGVLSLVMARIVQDATGKDTKLAVQPIVKNPIKAQFYDAATAASVNNTNGIIGFYADGEAATVVGANDGNRDIAFSTRSIRTMHTSTGYDYVIVHSIVRSCVGAAGGVVLGDAVTNQVYALPVAPNATGIAVDFVGQVVRVKDDGTPEGFSSATNIYTPVVPTTYAQMPKATQAPAQVGAGLDLNILDGTYVSELVVSGDAVYVTLDGPNNHNAGIYQSSAIFNSNGFIRAWTPWQRVMGDMRRVMGMGLSNIDGTYTFLTTQLRTDLTTTNTFNTVRATSWGKTDDVTVKDPTVEKVAADNLSAVLTTLFPQTEGGVLSLHSFDEYTPGFKRGRFAMMVALGTSKVAIIQTGEFVGGEFRPVTTFNTTGANQNVFVFDATTSPVLGTIAPLTCAEVSRIGSADNSGWLFVSGRGGLAVLSLNVSGNGFTSYTDVGGGLTALGNATADTFPGGVNWSFKQLTPQNAANSFERTRKLSAAHGVLYEMTFNGLYSFTMNAAKFNAPAVNNLGELVPAIPANTKLNDMLLVEGTTAADDRVLLATTKGIALTGPTPFAAAFVDISDTGLSSPVIARFAYLGQNSKTTSNLGNLYALVQNLLSDKDSTYRFDVNIPNPLAANRVAAIREAGSAVTTLKSYIDFDQARSGILPTGTFLYSTRSEDFGETEFLKLHKISDTTTLTSDLTNNLDVETETNVLVDGLVREGATGTLMLPADWGVRVNQ